MELKAYQAYRSPEMEIFFWRTSTGLEVDFILGDMNVALEVKGTARVSPRDAAPLKALMAEHKVKKAIIVSMDSEPRIMADGIEVIPWEPFVRMLWDGAFEPL
jgi:predicted AAA+ superfamily ATPase